jgi:hypothetical protein
MAFVVFSVVVCIAIVYMTKDCAACRFVLSIDIPIVYEITYTRHNRPFCVCNPISPSLTSHASLPTAVVA